MRWLIGILTIELMLTSGLMANAEEKPMWLAVGNAEFVEALQPLVDHRRRQGFEAVVSSLDLSDAMASLPRRPDFLLLVGDDQPGEESEPWYLASRRPELYRWRHVQPKQFASDALHGDVDRDDQPDLAVGRIPARSVEQVRIVVAKILAFERREPSPDDLRLVAWTGTPGYSPLIDRLASEMLVSTVRKSAPAWSDAWMIAGTKTHPLCGWPPDQPVEFTQQIRRGGLLSVLMGHGSATGFFAMSHEGGSIGYSKRDFQTALAEGPPTAPCVVFACDCGNFTHEQPCLTESLLFLPGGPVATIGATTESHPLTNYFSGQAMLASLANKPDSIGTFWLETQRRAKRMREFLVERLLRDVEGKLEAEIDVTKLRRDQMLMYALLGDPATRLRLPKPLVGSLERTKSGWHWTVERPPKATELHLGFRAASTEPISVSSSSADRLEMRRALHEANRAFAFRPSERFGTDRVWEGTLDAPGSIRLIATGPESFHVLVLEAKLESATKGDRLPSSHGASTNQKKQE